VILNPADDLAVDDVMTQLDDLLMIELMANSRLDLYADYLYLVFLSLALYKDLMIDMTSSSSMMLMRESFKEISKVVDGFEGLSTSSKG
jgi:hypothetical protein